MHNITLKPPGRGAKGKAKMTTTENTATEKKIQRVYYTVDYYVESEFSVELESLPEDAVDEDDFVGSAVGGFYDGDGWISLQADEDGNCDEVDTDPYSNDLEHNNWTVSNVTRITVYEDGTRDFKTLS
tara:strand:+ start:2103 stop:2486 length:384 start_codon:yes stop_codon:yes gene_type:complete